MSILDGGELHRPEIKVSTKATFNGHLELRYIIISLSLVFVSFLIYTTYSLTFMFAAGNTRAIDDTQMFIIEKLAYKPLLPGIALVILAASIIYQLATMAFCWKKLSRSILLFSWITTLVISSLIVAIFLTDNHRFNNVDYLVSKKFVKTTFEDDFLYFNENKVRVEIANKDKTIEIHAPSQEGYELAKNQLLSIREALEKDNYYKVY